MLQEFIDHLNSKVGKSVYVWGGQGQKGSQITEAWIRKRDTSESNARRSINFWNDLKRKMPASEIWAFDCSGLAIYWLYDLKHLLTGDASADRLFKSHCASISKSQLKKGDWVFTYSNNSGKITHIGYVVDDQLNVVEAKGRDYGVVKKHLSKGSWNRFGRPHLFKDEIEGKSTKTTIEDAKVEEDISETTTSTSETIASVTETTKITAITRTLKLASPYIRGDDVMLLQTYLLENGYAIDEVDGVFGPVTQKAVKAFQKVYGLTTDGIAGTKTLAAMGLKG